jgi:hypothetical protein
MFPFCSLDKILNRRQGNGQPQQPTPKGNDMTTNFSNAIDKTTALIGFDAMIQVMQFAKRPDWIQIGTIEFDQYAAAKRQFYRKLFRDNPLGATVAVALSFAIENTNDTNDFVAYGYDNNDNPENKDIFFGYQFDMYLDDWSMIRDSGYLGGQSQHMEIFDLIGKDLRDWQRDPKATILRPLSDYIDTLEHRRLESLRCDAQYMAKLSMQENHTFYSVKDIANALFVFTNNAKDMDLIQYYVSEIYGKYRFDVINGLTKNLESK